VKLKGANAINRADSIDPDIRSIVVSFAFVLLRPSPREQFIHRGSNTVALVFKCGDLFTQLTVAMETISRGCSTTSIPSNVKAGFNGAPASDAALSR
jgi:hypothetical protein